MSTRLSSLKSLAIVGVLAGLGCGHLAAAAEPRLSLTDADLSRFPIGVWMQSPFRAPEYRAIGINLFVGLYDGPTEDQLALLAKYKMPVIVAQNDVALNSPHASIIFGWMQGDEPDNAQPLLSGAWGACIPAIDVAETVKLVGVFQRAVCFGLVEPVE